MDIEQLQTVNKNANSIICRMMDATGLETRIGDPVMLIELLKKERDSLKGILEYLLETKVISSDIAVDHATKALKSLSQEKRR